MSRKPPRPKNVYPDDRRISTGHLGSDEHRLYVTRYRDGRAYRTETIACKCGYGIDHMEQHLPIMKPRERLSGGKAPQPL